MGAPTYMDAVFSALENQGVTLNKPATVEKGSIKDEELVLLRLFRDKSAKEATKIKSFEVEIGDSYRADLIPLSTLHPMAFIVHQREFDSFYASSKFEDGAKQNMEALHEREATLATLQCIANTKGTDNLSDDEKKKLKKAKEAVQVAKELISEHNDKLFDAYERMFETRKHKFLSYVREECLTAKTHMENKVVYIREAFTVDSEGAATAERLPEKDKDEEPDDPKTAGWMFNWRWERQDVPVHGMPGKTLELFKKLRKLHVEHELDGKFGYAEAQFYYMLHNIKLPNNCSIDALDNMIEQISSLMYLLPSIHDDPNPAYDGGVLNYKQRRNKPFAEGEKTEMLFNAMPHYLQRLWKLDNDNQLVPTDRAKLKLALKILMEKHKDELERERLLELEEVDKKKNGGGRGKHGKGSRNDAGKGAGTPPRTPTASGGGTPGEKHCKFCKANNERQEAYSKHTTAKCKKYLNVSGKLNPDWVAPGTFHKQTNAHQKGGADTPLSAKKRSSKKSKKKRKKRSKSSRKKHKKARKHYHSSSSDDSSTSSSSSSSSDSS